MRRLPEYDFANRGTQKNESQFDPLLDGNIWEVTLEDFDGRFKSLNSLRTGVYGVAKKKGMKVRTSVNGDRMVIQAYRDNGLHGMEEASRRAEPGKVWRREVWYFNQSGKLVGCHTIDCRSTTHSHWVEEEV